MALLTFESRGVRLVLFEPAEKSCTKQIHLQAENHTWKVALLGIFLNGISWPLSLSLFHLLALLSQRPLSIGEP